MPRPSSTPNVIVILADDMGYGDASCYNPDGKIATQNIDAMATGGMRFTNAHATSAVCTPSRYGLLTGRYCWRSRLKSSIVWQWDSPLIESNQTTVAGLLQRAGYRTACIGKWHLGWDWKNEAGESLGEQLPFGVMDHALRARVAKHVDYRQRIGGGPVDCGFDSYFGVDVPNFPPYTWFEDDRVSEIPTTVKPDGLYGEPGDAIPDWQLEDMLPAFAKRAVTYIEDAAASEQPFFLYLPLTSPHSPVVPNKEFQGQSGAGNFGDFVLETDWVVGEVRDALERLGIRDDTLLVFTSDNGPERRVGDDIGAYERLETYNHASMGSWRGIKRDIWEGGHRVPFIAEWPAAIPASATCDQLITLGDVFATVAEIVGVTPEPFEGEDSMSMLPLLTGGDTPTRDHAIYHSQNGLFGIYRDGWVLIDGPSGGENPVPEWFDAARGYHGHELPKELFNLNDDPSERFNRFAEEPELAAELAAVLAEVQRGRHPPGEVMDDEVSA